MRLRLPWVGGPTATILIPLRGCKFCNTLLHIGMIDEYTRRSRSILCTECCRKGLFREEYSATVDAGFQMVGVFDDAECLAEIVGGYVAGETSGYLRTVDTECDLVTVA